MEMTQERHYTMSMYKIYEVAAPYLRYLIIITLFFFMQCASANIMHKDERVSFIDSIQDQDFRIKKDIPLLFNQSKDGFLFRKGDIVRLNLENDKNWLKIRAYKLTDTHKEEAIYYSKTILYIIKDFLDKEKYKQGYTRNLLEAELHPLLEPIGS